MLLSTLERLVLANVPFEGDITTLKLVKDFKDAIWLSEADHEKLKMIKFPNGSIKWGKETGGVEIPPKEVAVGAKLKETVAETLKRMSDQKQLSENHYSVYEKFVGVPDFKDESEPAKEGCKPCGQGQPIEEVKGGVKP